MNIQLVCTTQLGEAVCLSYAPGSNQLLGPGGVGFFKEATHEHFSTVPIFSPENPVGKAAEVSALKIQLGMACNYACVYCNQGQEAEKATVTRTQDAEGFLANLDRWLKGTPSRVEFWGGEPLLYLSKLKVLLPALRARFPEADFGLVTNGSLLNEDAQDLLEQHDVFLAVSHDGPGQTLRGPDPFEDAQKADWLRRAWQRRKDTARMSFNSVITPANANLQQLRQWFIQAVGDEQVVLNPEGVVTVYDDTTLQSTGHWSEAQYQLLHKSVVTLFETGEYRYFSSIARRARDFLQSVYEGRPSSALGQKCGMDKPSHLAVDLNGNVLTCQNTGASGKHRIGHVDDFEGIALNTSWHWSQRPHCPSCPVLQLCKGSCMYLTGDKFARSCENEYRYNTAILAGLLKQTTGLNFHRFEGNFTRPVLRTVIPMVPA